MMNENDLEKRLKEFLPKKHLEDLSFQIIEKINQEKRQQELIKPLKSFAVISIFLASALILAFSVHSFSESGNMQLLSTILSGKFFDLKILLMILLNIGFLSLPAIIPFASIRFLNKKYAR